MDSVDLTKIAKNGDEPDLLRRRILQGEQVGIGQGSPRLALPNAVRDLVQRLPFVQRYNRHRASLVDIWRIGSHIIVREAKTRDRSNLKALLLLAEHFVLEAMEPSSSLQDCSAAHTPSRSTSAPIPALAARAKIG